MLSTSRGSKRCAFSKEGRTFYHEVFFRMYVPLALEVYNRLFIDNLGFMAVHEIKKLILGLNQSNIQTLALMPALTLRSGQNVGAVMIVDFIRLYRCS